MSNGNHRVHELLKPNRPTFAPFNVGDVVFWKNRKYTVGLRLGSGFYTQEDLTLYIPYHYCDKSKGTK